MKHRSLITDAGVNKLEQPLGRLHAKLRLGIELDHGAQIFGQGINFFHIENWYSVHSSFGPHSSWWDYTGAVVRIRILKKRGAAS
jgi:hypothetical protein